MNAHVRHRPEADGLRQALVPERTAGGVVH